MKNESKTFIARIPPSILKTLVKLLGGIDTNAIKLRFTSKKITITAIDKAMVAMVCLQMEKNVFERFEATEFEISIYMERLRKIVNLVETDDSIIMRFDSKENQFIIKLDDLETRMGIVDVGETANLPPKILDSSGHVVLCVNDIRRSIIDAENVSDTLTLSIDSEKFELKAIKNMDSAHLTLSKEKLFEHHTETHHKKSYSTSDLNNIISCLNGDNRIRIEFGSETQLQLDYDFLENGGHMTYVLMPRIEE